MSKKAVTVSFEYNTKTDSVTNIKCFIDGIEKKKKTTTKKPDVDEPMAKNAIVILEPNRLTFNNKAIADLSIEYEDRIVVKWDKEKGSKNMSPYIGKDISFDEEGAGNKVTKGLTVSYRGNANKLLSQLGTMFTLGEDNNGIFKLIPYNSSEVLEAETLEEALEAGENTELDIIVDSEDTTEIEEINFKL